MRSSSTRTVVSAISVRPGSTVLSGEARLVEIVETDHGDVVWNAQTGLLQHAHRAERERVIQPEHGIEAHPGGEELRIAVAPFDRCQSVVSR